MRINNNMSAVITNNQLLGTESSLADVMEKIVRYQFDNNNNKGE